MSAGSTAELTDWRHVMAKMFYSIEEAAQRLGKSAEQVKEMAASGQLQEFRDRDKLMFKREQVDLLSGDAGTSGAGMIPLADSRAGSGLGLSLEDSSPGIGMGRSSKSGKPSKGGSGVGIDLDTPSEKNPNQRSGISIFDTEPDNADPLAATAISQAVRGPDLQMDTVGGSGSGLLDLTRESDDTSLGADLLEDVYKPDADSGETTGSSGLFEHTAAPSDISSAAAGAAAGMAMAYAEPYDGKSSGWGGGLALGAVVACLVATFAALSGLLGAGDSDLVRMITSNFMPVAGALAAVVFIPAIIGFVIAKK